MRSTLPTFNFSFPDFSIISPNLGLTFSADEYSMIYSLHSLWESLSYHSNLLKLNTYTYLKLFYYEFRKV